MLAISLLVLALVAGKDQALAQAQPRMAPGPVLQDGLSQPLRWVEPSAKGGKPGAGGTGGKSDAGRAGNQQGTVIRVTDGDSLWVKPAQGKAIEVRLGELDAPERCQAGGADARLALRRLTLGKIVTLETVAVDRYGRTIARVQVGGLDVAPYLVMQGHAWSQRGRWGDGPLIKQERAAQAAQRGLHAVPGAMRPAEFRKKNGSCYAGRGGARASVNRGNSR